MPLVFCVFSNGLQPIAKAKSRDAIVRVVPLNGLADLWCHSVHTPQLERLLHHTQTAAGVAERHDSHDIFADVRALVAGEVTVKKAMQEPQPLLVARTADAVRNFLRK